MCRKTTTNAGTVRSAAAVRPSTLRPLRTAFRVCVCGSEVRSSACAERVRGAGWVRPVAGSAVLAVTIISSDDED
jgi:hypothetical protein